MLNQRDCFQEVTKAPCVPLPAAGHSASEALRSPAVLGVVLSVPVASFRLMGNTAEQLEPARTPPRTIRCASGDPPPRT